MASKAFIVRIDGQDSSQLSCFDRGLAYGDGIFETLRVVNGDIPLLKYHRERFVRGIERLHMGDSKRLIDAFDDELAILLKKIELELKLDKALIKVILTRGVGGRGYAPPVDNQSSLISQVFDLPAYPQQHLEQGIKLALCSHRLSVQPILAGIKHLNRLDQVIAARELNGNPEGVMLSQSGEVIEGTKSNILVFENGKILTPLLSNEGVAGTMRAFLLEESRSEELELQETPISLERLKNASGIAMINSVFGIWPVSDFDNQAYQIPEQFYALHRLIQSKLRYFVNNEKRTLR